VGEEERGKTTTFPPERVRHRDVAVAAVLVAVGAFALCVGLYDSVRADEPLPRLAGAILLLAGLLLCSAAGALATRRPWRHMLGFIACFVASLFGAYLLVASVASEDLNALLLVWAAMAVVPLRCALVLRRNAGPALGEDVRRRLKVLVSVVTVGAVIGIGQFVYTALYVPTTAAASLSVLVTLEPVGERGGQTILRGTATVRNTAGTRVKVLGSMRTVLGSRITDETRSPRDFAKDLQKAAETPLLEARRYAVEEPSVPVQSGHLFDYGTYLEPNEEIARDVVAYVPKGRFDMARLNVVVAVARGRNLATADEPDSPRVTRVRGCGKRITSTAPIVEVSLLRYLTRGRREVVSEWQMRDIDGETYPDLRVYVDRHGRQPREQERPRGATPGDTAEAGAPQAANCMSDAHDGDPYNRRLREFYGLAYTDGTVTQPLPSGGR